MTEDNLPQRVWGKLAVWLIVPIAMITFVNSIDRVNVSYAGNAMSADLALTPEQFGRGVSMFFIAYLLFQYPHVRLLKVLGIKVWLSGSMLVWGISGFWMAHVENATEFYAARFLLGMAEAGFAPGMTWLISRWTPPSLRARALSGALVAVPLSMVLGGPLCGWLLGIGNDAEMAAWRYMFLVIAIPNVVLAILAALWFVDTPDKAGWLTREERAWLSLQMQAGQGAESPVPPALRQIAADPWLWRCCLGWLLVMTGSYALVFWLPQVVRQLDIGSSEFMIGTLSAVPMLGLALGLLLNGRRSDKTGERLWHTGVPAGLAGLAMMIAALLPPGWAVLGLLTLAGFFIGATQGVFWSIPSAMRVGGDTVPVGAIALISMFGTAGGIIGPWLTGVLAGSGSGFALAIALLAGLLLLAFPVIAVGSRRAV